MKNMIDRRTKKCRECRGEKILFWSGGGGGEKYGFWAKIYTGTNDIIFVCLQIFFE